MNMEDGLVAKICAKECSLYTVNPSYVTLYLPFVTYTLHSNPNSEP
jgi:hypothetical protein